MIRLIYTKLKRVKQNFLLMLYLTKTRYSIKTPIKKIYILCAQGAGDYLMATSAIHAISKSHQECDIYIVFTRSEAYLLAELNDIHCSHNLLMISEVISGSHEIDMLISLSGPSIEVVTLINRTRPINVIGFIFSFKIFSSFDKSTNINYLFDNHIKRNDEIVKKLSAEPDGNIHFTYLNVDNPNQEEVRKIGLYFPYVKKQKTLAPKILVEFSQSIIIGGKFDAVCLFNYEGEKDKVKEIFSIIKSQSNEYSNISSELYDNWRELLKILQMFNKVICTDSVVFHLCNALDIPVVGVFGPTNPNNYVPNNFTGGVVTHNSGPKYCYYGTGYNKCMKGGCVDRCNFMSKITTYDLEDAI
jgi:ADP-heptose:LPS heptosyltransferase